MDNLESAKSNCQIIPNSTKCNIANDHNVTSYNVGNEGFTWHKDQNKRSNLEICTAVYIKLKAHDQAGKTA